MEHTGLVLIEKGLRKTISLVLYDEHPDLQQLVAATNGSNMSS